MHSIECYKDLIIEIELSKERIEDYKKQKKLLDKLMFKGPAGYTPIDMSGMPRGSRNDISLDRLVDRLGNLADKINIEEEILEALLERASKTNEKLKKFEGINYKIAYKKLIENKTYRVIAAEVKLSEDRVKHIGAEIKRRI